MRLLHPSVSVTSEKMVTYNQKKQKNKKKTHRYIPTLHCCLKKQTPHSIPNIFSKCAQMPDGIRGFSSVTLILCQWVLSFLALVREEIHNIGHVIIIH